MSKKEIKWSEQQILAIDTTDTNILVSAGAGSGKTAVLTERIYRLVAKGTPIDKFLVLTFTNAAAAEMKDRIRESLLEDDNTKSQAPLVDSSHIETFDAFALYVVKRFHHHLGINADVNLINNSILEIKKNKLLEEILNEYYEKEDKTFLEIVEAYCVKDDNQIFDLILNILKVADLQLDKEKFFNTFIDNYCSEEKVNSFINECYKERIDSIKTILCRLKELESVTDQDNLTDALEPLLKNKDYDSLRNAILEFTFPTKPKEKNNDKALRDYLKSIFPSLKDSDYGSSAEIKEIINGDIEFIKTLLTIARRLDEEIYKFKKEHNAYSFQDIAKMALELISMKDVGKILKESFDYILVDEYQDTSDIQEKVIQALGKDKNNIYMVGDVKQSIYRFRNANCSIFQDKYNSYLTSKQENKGLRIDLNESFRSRKEVVDAINEFFSKLMHKDHCVIDYSDGHYFKFGQKNYLQLLTENQSNDVELFTYNVTPNVSSTEIEAKIIAEDIIKKYNSKYQIADAKKFTKRDARFSDFAILIDRATDFDEYRKVFNEYGIPLNIKSETDIATSDLVFSMKNLLILLSCSLNQDYENKRYYHAFTSVARSFLVRLDDQTILNHVKNKTVLTEKFILKIELLKEKIRYKSLYETLISIYETFDVYNKIITIGDFKANTSQAEMLLDIASNMDQLGYTLDDFILYFEDLDKYDIKLEFADNNASEDSVYLMTIHKSKGLEFPICYFPGLGKKFFDSSSKSSFIVSDKYGLVLPLRIHTHLSSLTNHLFKSSEKHENLQEKLRLYYVALTRPKEKIILIEGIKEKEKEKFAITECNSFLEFNNFLKLRQKYGVPKEIENVKLNKVVKKHQPKQIKIIKPDFEVPKIIKTTKASKDVNDEANLENLRLGERMHYLLEIIDFETKDTSFIKDEKERKMIEKVLSLNIFKGVKNDNVLHEYDFYDEQNNVHGIIDCILVKDDEVDIIDFKLKNINDEEYIKQLKIYKNYVKTITKKPIKTYLLSISLGMLRKIHDEVC